MRINILLRLSIALPLAIAGLIGCGNLAGCNKPADNPLSGESSDAPATTPGSVAAVPEAPPAPVDPFTPLVRLDPKQLPPACEGVVAVFLQIDGRPSSLLTGFVFDEDEQSAYIVVADRQSIYSGSGAQVLEFSFAAVVGPQDAAKVVPLQVARRYPQAWCAVLSGPKKDLPKPLSPTADIGPTTIGRRLQLIGYDHAAQTVNQDFKMGFARTTEPVEIIPSDKQQRARPFNFFVDKPVMLRVNDGLLATDDGTPVALADFGEYSASPGYACYPIACLQRFKQPELAMFTARPALRLKAGDTRDGFRIGMAIQNGEKVEAQVETPIRVQCIEYPRPLSKFRLLVSTQSLNLRADSSDLSQVPKSWAYPDNVVVPRTPISNDRWEGAPADVHELPLDPVATVKAEFVEDHTGFPNVIQARTTPAKWPHLATYSALHKLPQLPQEHKFHLQCVFDDADGVTKLLGPEQTVHTRYLEPVGR